MVSSNNVAAGLVESWVYSEVKVGERRVKGDIVSTTVPIQCLQTTVTLWVTIELTVPSGCCLSADQWKKVLNTFSIYVPCVCGCVCVCVCASTCVSACMCVAFLLDTHIHGTESINGRHCLQSLMLMPATHTLERSKNFPLARVEHFGCTFCRCCPPLNYPSTSFLNPLLFGSYKKKKSHIKQPDVSPVSSVIHKTPNTPHSSLMLYEKLKLNQGSVIKLSDFCWIRMKSCVCHIVCWKCAWGACGL